LRVIQSIRIFAIIVSLAAFQLARADECGNAVTDYNTVLPRLTDAVQHFSNCVANSLGLDTCAKEFNSLRSVYGEFQSAVTLYKKECI
jgi:hypothetical protein